MKKITSSCSIPFVLGLALAGQMQNPPVQQTKIGSSAESRTVLLDVVVKDSKERHVKDLRPEEFEIFEDGVRQRIDSVELSADGTTPSPKARTAAAPALIPPGYAARVNIITFLMDFSSTTLPDQKYVRDGAVKYVKDKIGPSDLVAVYAVGGGDMRSLQAFTSDKAQLLEILAKADLSGASKRATADAARSKNTESSASSTAQSGDTVQLRAMLGDRLDSGFSAMRAFGDSLMARPVLSAIKSIALAERDIPGRKTLILFSEGFPMPPSVEEVMRDSTDAANKSNLAIYALDVKGLTNRGSATQGELQGINAGGADQNRAASQGVAGGGGPGTQSVTPTSVDLTAIGTGGGRTVAKSGESIFDRARQVGSDREESSLRFLTNSTGGLLIRNTNDFAGALGRIDEDLRTYYLIRYSPANQEFDGKFRTLRVESTRSGVKVRSRNGYYATTSNDALLTVEQLTLFANARDRKTAPTLALYAAADELFPDGRMPVAVVTVEVSTDSIDLKENGPLSEGALQIVGLVSDEKGKSITTFGRALPIQMGKEQLESARGGFLSHSETVSLQPGNYKVEVLVSEPSSGHYGYYSKQITLNSPAGFALGDVILGHQIAKAAPDVKMDPMVIDGAIVVPSATRRFRNGDRLIFYFDLYHAQINDGKTNVEITLGLSCNGRQLQAKLPGYKISAARKPGERIQVAKYLELAGLPPGNYSLRIEARDLNGGSKGSSEAAFRIIN